MNNLTDLLQEQKKAFANQFWLHRVPKNTKQTKDIEDFLTTALTKGYELALEEVENEAREKNANTEPSNFEENDFNAGKHEAYYDIIFAVDTKLAHLKETNTK